MSLSKQRVYVMEGSNMLMAMPVSVGTPQSPTPSGNFTTVNIAHSQPEDATTHVPLAPDAGPLPDYHPAELYWTDRYFVQHKTPVYQ